MQVLRRRPTEQYGENQHHNEFNVQPQVIPDWLQDWLENRGGYMIGNIRTGAYVPDHVTATVFQPVLQPVGDDLWLNVEFVVVLVFAVLLRWSSPKHLHRFAGHPVVLQQELPQVMGPLPAVDP